MRRLLCIAALLLVPPLDAARAASRPGSPRQAPQRADTTIPAFRGRVLDPSRAPIAGAVIVATAGQAAPTTTRSDSRGEFTLPLPAAPVAIRISSDGFVELAQTVTVAAGAADVHEFVLTLAAIVETVNVDAPTLRTPVVSSATKTPTPVRDVPQAISVVTSTLIGEQRMRSMADVVRYMPGVGMAQGEGNRDTPILRGNSSTSDFFVDGVRDDVQYFRDVYNVERVEALKGPNAMIFGRGGVGGVINRVTRQADWSQPRELSVQLGSWDNRRLTADIGQSLTNNAAARLTGLYENSNSYRDGVGNERVGLNPTVAFRPGPQTTLRAGYEYFHDERTADRGISSFNGRPVESDASTFFGDPDRSPVDATINVLSSVLEHRFASGATLRNRLSYGDYDKFYQNVFPGALDSTGTNVSLSAYNNATDRQNFFNQTDMILLPRTGAIDHTVLLGAEFGRQVTDNFRSTGFFTSPQGPAVATVFAPLSQPTISIPLEFRQNATDADNSGVASIAAVYVQDQIELSSHLQAVVGVRFDSFNVDFTNNRTGGEFSSRDDLLSPRFGLVYKPLVPVSIYGSYSLTYLPRAGEQLASLSLTSQALDPEEFRNYEIGAKWDVNPGLGFSAAVYRLDRGNVAVADPADTTRSILVDAQRTTGVELELNGRLTKELSVTGGYAFQDGEITRSISATAQAGAVLAQLPRHSFSLWSKYDLAARWGVALGVIHRSRMFTSTDNTVVLPGFTRVDAAVFFDVNPRVRAQVNVENLLDEEYYASAHSNTNITPGSPRALHFALTTRF